MKKKEWIIVGIIAVIAAAAILITTLLRNTASSAVSDTEPSEKAKGQWVAIVHRNHVAQWFDSGVDGEYTVEGDYGTMTVECKDGKWHVESVECPNHTCEQMGWDDGTNFMPITCIPNNIFIGTSQWVESYLSENEESE